MGTKKTAAATAAAEIVKKVNDTFAKGGQQASHSFDVSEYDEKDRDEAEALLTADGFICYRENNAVNLQVERNPKAKD